MRRLRAALVAALISCGAAGAAPAAEGDEHLSLSGGLPVTIEDAGSIERGDLDLKARLYYERARGGGRHRLTVDPEIEVGIAPNLSLGLSPTHEAGGAAGDERGEVEFEIEYAVLPQRGTGPGLLVEPLIVLPYGPGDASAEAGIAIRATQPLTSSPTGPRLHLNGRWLRLLDPAQGQRDDRFLVAAGVNLTLAPRTALAFDLVREQSQERGETENLVEAGIRHELAEKLSLGLGVGVGIGPDSPRYRLLLGVQRSF